PATEGEILRGHAVGCTHVHRMNVGFLVPLIARWLVAWWHLLCSTSPTNRTAGFRLDRVCWRGGVCCSLTACTGCLGCWASAGSNCGASSTCRPFVATTFCSSCPTTPRTPTRPCCSKRCAS